MFERFCHHNGITARLAKPRSPASGEIERFHKRLRHEFLDQAGPLTLLSAFGSRR
ncbi:hypothetical protein ACFFMN_42580 [Planobispora siamensis]|uniref:Integrase catalytic domain-containing protein n=1 Tax=Planobispora siamensis TaxID=936338 RepID=A0A8J3SP23_9ACTN|nr:hypothetical protein Psi01_83470 [Planobispora siamensis]